MKISILYTYDNEAILREVAEGTEENPSQFNVPVIRVTEMLDDTYHTVIDSELVSDFEDALKLPPAKMTFVGSYYLDSGEQFVWVKPTEKSRNHKIAKYHARLRKVEGENGQRPPTEEEALATTVNLIAGYPKRILEDA